MHLFPAAIGAQSMVAEIMRGGPVVFYFTLAVVAVHGAVRLGMGRMARIDLPTLALASLASIRGAGLGGALATARGWRPVGAGGRDRSSRICRGELYGVGGGSPHEGHPRRMSGDR